MPTSHLLMIRPVNFGFNEQTAVNNTFQVRTESKNVQENAMNEFDALVENLRSHGIDVTVISDTQEPHTPDSIFPNNWISFHENGTVILYPMFAPNRRLERKPEIFQQIGEHFNIKKTIDLTRFENREQFLEGTGSMVLDREQRIAYACISPRTNPELLQRFCEEMNYKAIRFSAADKNGVPVYHTNVMMCVADRYVVICLECITDVSERKQVVETITQSGKEIIEISFAQMGQFAGNMLQVENNTGEKFLVLSTQAYNSLTEEQVKKLSSWNRIIHSSLDTIETNGGGSARCMIAEVFT